MRDFDISVDDHPFARETPRGRPASQLVEIVSTGPISETGVFDLPVLVRISHNVADLKHSSLSVFFAEGVHDHQDDGETYATDTIYSSYTKVSGATFDGLTASVGITGVGKLVVLDSASHPVQHVYIHMEIPRAGPEMLQLEVPVRQGIVGKLSIYPKCSMWRPRDASGPFPLAVGAHINRLVMRPHLPQQRMARVLNDPLAYPERFLACLNTSDGACVGQAFLQSQPQIRFLSSLTDPQVATDVGDEYR
jgi:hypothetical protein